MANRFQISQNLISNLYGRENIHITEHSCNCTENACEIVCFGVFLCFAAFLSRNARFRRRFWRVVLNCLYYKVVKASVGRDYCQKFGFSDSVAKSMPRMQRWASARSHCAGTLNFDLRTLLTCLYSEMQLDAFDLTTFWKLNSAPFLSGQKSKHVGQVIYHQSAAEYHSRSRRGSRRCRWLPRVQALHQI